jgi:hypothetical protein
VPPSSRRRRQPGGTERICDLALELRVHISASLFERRASGLYRLDEGSRIDDAITAAGGPSPKAALDLGSAKDGWNGRRNIRPSRRSSPGS